jgi:hypothetical protein
MFALNVTEEAIAIAFEVDFCAGCIAMNIGRHKGFKDC